MKTEDSGVRICNGLLPVRINIYSYVLLSESCGLPTRHFTVYAQLGGSNVLSTCPSTSPKLSKVISKRYAHLLLSQASQYYQMSVLLVLPLAKCSRNTPPLFIASVHFSCHFFVICSIMLSVSQKSIQIIGRNLSSFSPLSS